MQGAGSGKWRATAVEQMQSYLTPRVQVKEIENAGAISTLHLPKNTKIVEEGVLPAPFGDPPKDQKMLSAYKHYWASVKGGKPISQAVTPCYRELVIASISVSKGMGSLKFSSSFVYRVFDERQSEIKIFDGEHSLPKPDHFPAQSPDDVSLASAALRSTFSANFTQWVAHRVKF